MKTPSAAPIPKPPGSQNRKTYMQTGAASKPQARPTTPAGLRRLHDVQIANPPTATPRQVKSRSRSLNQPSLPHHALPAIIPEIRVLAGQPRRRSASHDIIVVLVLVGARRGVDAGAATRAAELVIVGFGVAGAGVAEGRRRAHGDGRHAGRMRQQRAVVVRRVRVGAEGPRQLRVVGRGRGGAGRRPLRWCV